MTRRRRRGTTRRIGDLIEDVLDRASDVEYDLRRAARKAVEHRDGDGDGDDWDGDWDWDDCSDDEIEEILDDLVDLLRKLRRCDSPRGRRGSRDRSHERGPGRSREGVDDLADHIARLGRKVDGLSQQVRASRSDSEAD
ncbi:hypothetical protein [Planomonospora venezuelensis]|uniref:Uncharacterized protein n=1 Tax=Planomonospora venezuelensis TaxID=1999 RepID=A0A841DJA4_PLAVE|nr:hypothetical protein [Planomonospora venezuelensis]MBB5967216.1 hypothetical protein [Planomonospora venezuelensis]GIN02987.1 hypothetical protein Pve01_46450 [Planomonospora venezuelensis]